MKYNININQFAGQKHFKNLDILDLAILDYFKDFAHNSLKINDDSGMWFWISNQKIIDDMPVLGIKSKRGIQTRIKKLIDSGIIIRHKDSMSLGRSYYQFTPKFDKYLYNNTLKDNKVDQEQKDTPTKNDAHPYEKPSAPPTKNDASDYSIKDSFIIDSSLKENEINKKGYLYFKECFKEKFNSEYIPPKNKNATYQTNAIGELIKLRPKDIKQFIAHCFLIENKYYLSKISPAYILANYSEYCVEVASLNEIDGNNRGMNYQQARNMVTNNPGMSFQDFEKVGQGKNITYYPKK